MEKEKKSEKYFNLRMPNEIRTKLEQISEKDQRTMASMILWLIGSHWDKVIGPVKRETLASNEDSTE
jgi:predicted DNA-binding protein